MTTTERGHAVKPAKSTIVYSEEYGGMDDDDDDECDYGDFALLGTGKATHGKGSKKTKGGTGKIGPYSAKHTRLRESRKSGK